MEDNKAVLRVRGTLTDRLRDLILSVDGAEWVKTKLKLCSMHIQHHVMLMGSSN